MGLAGDGSCKVVGSAANRQAGGGVASLFQILQLAMSVAGFTLGGGTQHSRYVVVTLDIDLGGEIGVAAIILGFSGQSSFEISSV